MMKKKVAFWGWIATLLAGIFLLCSCRTELPSYFAYREKAFSAEIGWKDADEEKRAKVSVTPEGSTYGLEIEYLAPPALAGITLRGRCEGNGSLCGEATASFDGVELEVEAEALGRFFQPATAFLAGEKLLRVEREREEYRVALESGWELSLDASGVPKRCHGETVDFWVVWWEFPEKSN